jgi:hypothetical protein
MNIQRPPNLPEAHADSWIRLSQFAERSGKVLHEQLGWGVEGLVYSTTTKTAIKAYRHEELYKNERNVYLRLRQRGIRSANRFRVPQFIDADDQLWVLEMTVVSPPFILDFAGAYLDRKPPFSSKQLAEWMAEKADQFENRWPEVRAAMSVFRRHGIYLNDVKHGNVAFDDAGG